MTRGVYTTDDVRRQAWRRCPELGCGEAGGHAGGHVPEAVPPIPLPPPMPREERTTDAPPAAPCVVCGAREHLAIDCPCFVPRGDRVRAVAAPPSPVVDQPPPLPCDGPAIWDLVVDDMRDRDRVGRARYGTPLRAHNGRDALVDAYQEALDLVVYLRQAIEERRELLAALAVLIDGGEPRAYAVADYNAALVVARRALGRPT